MCDDQAKEERKKIYATTRQDLLTRNLSNSEKYDNAILTLSTGILGLSLAFIKDIVPLEKAQYIFLLRCAWWLFGASIMVVLCSFFVSQWAIKNQLEYAEKYYLDEKEEFLNKKNHPAIWTERINWGAGGFFILGIITIIIFVSANTQGVESMAKDPGQITRHTQDGATIPAFQKVQTDKNSERGQPVPSMQPVKTTTTSTQQQSGNTQTKTNETTK